jgi:osmotically inducible lipoprotein OsmB
MRKIALVAVTFMSLATAGCQNLDTQQQRALSGGAIGAGAGAAVGLITGANPWVLGALGAAGGAAVGALTDKKH